MNPGARSPSRSREVVARHSRPGSASGLPPAAAAKAPYEGTRGCSSRSRMGGKRSAAPSEDDGASSDAWGSCGPCSPRAKAFRGGRCATSERRGHQTSGAASSEASWRPAEAHAKASWPWEHGRRRPYGSRHHRRRRGRRAQGAKGHSRRRAQSCEGSWGPDACGSRSSSCSGATLGLRCLGLRDTCSLALGALGRRTLSFYLGALRRSGPSPPAATTSNSLARGTASSADGGHSQGALRDRAEDASDPCGQSCEAAEARGPAGASSGRRRAARRRAASGGGTSPVAEVRSRRNPKSGAPPQGALGSAEGPPPNLLSRSYGRDCLDDDVEDEAKARHNPLQ